MKSSAWRFFNKIDADNVLCVLSSRHQLRWAAPEPISPHYAHRISSATPNLNNKEINLPLENVEMKCRHHLFSICCVFFPILFLNLAKCHFPCFVVFFPSFVRSPPYCTHFCHVYLFNTRSLFIFISCQVFST